MCVYIYIYIFIFIYFYIHIIKSTQSKRGERSRTQTLRRCNKKTRRRTGGEYKEGYRKLGLFSNAVHSCSARCYASASTLWPHWLEQIHALSLALSLSLYTYICVCMYVCIYIYIYMYMLVGRALSFLSPCAPLRRYCLVCPDSVQRPVMNRCSPVPGIYIYIYMNNYTHV